MDSSRLNQYGTTLPGNTHQGMMLDAQMQTNQFLKNVFQMNQTGISSETQTTLHSNNQIPLSPIQTPAFFPSNWSYSYDEFTHIRKESHGNIPYVDEPYIQADTVQPLFKDLKQVREYDIGQPKFEYEMDYFMHQPMSPLLSPYTTKQSFLKTPQDHQNVVQGTVVQVQEQVQMQQEDTDNYKENEDQSGQAQSVYNLRNKQYQSIFKKTISKTRLLQSEQVCSTEAFREFKNNETKEQLSFLQEVFNKQATKGNSSNQVLSMMFNKHLDKMLPNTIRNQVLEKSEHFCNILTSASHQAKNDMERSLLIKNGFSKLFQSLNQNAVGQNDCAKEMYQSEYLKQSEEDSDSKSSKKAFGKKILYSSKKKANDNRLRIRGKFVTKEQALEQLEAKGHSAENMSIPEIKQLIRKVFNGKEKTKKN